MTREEVVKLHSKLDSKLKKSNKLSKKDRRELRDALISIVETYDINELITLSKEYVDSLYEGVPSKNLLSELKDIYEI